ncbi:N-6 DNA methylase [Aurantimonas sp. E1-2-R+4]|uniref:Eco57I restriction-modification methylase domain-containing protein n=1 Tax=Aurantimonas sp. E1-2-R+4 TaxID=3113714 RepID=UPI002F940E9F
MAVHFGWTGRDLLTRHISRGATELDVARVSVAGKPAALFARVTAQNGADPLDDAALYAYHSSVDWGVVADRSGLTVFNSHWLSNGEWFRLPQIRWEDAAANREFLQHLTPGALVDRDIERFASKQKEPTSFLRPVDDELVDRLDGWRDQALRYASDAGRVDELLQTLYAQLFVLRTIEDRALDSQVPSLASTLTGPDRINWTSWSDLFEAARVRVGSDLFDEDVGLQIPEHVVHGVIRDLYQPRNLPGRSSRYDFSWIEADVLGLAYEKYLATVLQPAPRAPQFDMFHTAEREVSRVSVRKGSGAYYTPKFIRDYLATTCIEDFFDNSSSDNPPRVIDFACGSGSFLVAAVDQMLAHLKLRDPNRSWARELIDGGFIVGIDIDPRAVTTARLHLWQRLVQEPDALPLPNLSHVVITADGLDRGSWGELDRSYDIVLGNPPFLATSLISNREDLEARFATAKGRYDFSSLFVEQALQLLPPGGRLGIVVPNRLFKSRNGATLRSLLASGTNLLALVDFGSTRPFDADAYIGCIVARVRKPEEPAPGSVRVVEVRSLLPDFLAALLLASTEATAEVSYPAVHAYTARHPSSGGPWALLSETEQKALILIEEVSVRLDTIAAIPQGIRTGGNDLFIFEIESADGSGLCKAVNGLGESAILEIDLLQPVIYGSEVRRYENLRPAKRLLYPYRGNNVISEGEMEFQLPNTWAYFMRNRELLASRASLSKSGGKWYELVWPRDETWLKRPKLLIRDLAPRTAFALDQLGRTFIVGGTAVVPEDPDLLLPLLAYLNSDVVNGLVRRTTQQFRGDFQKFEPQHIQGIPILDRILEDEAFALQISSLAADVITAAAQGSENEAAAKERDIDALIRLAISDRGIPLSD